MPIVGVTMHTPPTPHLTPNILALTLAARAECDPRTAARALREGPGAIRTTNVRERLEREMRALGVEARRP
jgi:hypothetical protein